MQLDLNLLTALDALLDEGTVTGAAARLHVTTPAMSRTLGRIRRVTNDPILVRTGRFMTPTPHALAIRADVAALVQQSRILLSPQGELDLTMVERAFSIVAHDAVIDAISPALLAAIHAQAPGVVLRLLAEATTDTNDLLRGQVDLEVSATQATSTAIRTETVALHHLVVALRREHPLARGALNLERYAAARHVTISRRGRLHDPVDDALLASGLRRTVAAALPSAVAALDVVRHSDLLVVVPESRRLTEDLITRPLPVKLPPSPINLSWHRRYDHDEAHRWLRDTVRQVLLANASELHGATGTRQ